MRHAPEPMRRFWLRRKKPMQDYLAERAAHLVALSPDMVLLVAALAGVFCPSGLPVCSASGVHCAGAGADYDEVDLPAYLQMHMAVGSIIAGDYLFHWRQSARSLPSATREPATESWGGFIIAGGVGRRYRQPLYCAIGFETARSPVLGAGRVDGARAKWSKRRNYRLCRCFGKKAALNIGFFLGADGIGGGNTSAGLAGARRS